MAKQINISVERMKAFDNLPPKIRAAYEACAMRLDILDIAEQLKKGWPEEAILRAIKQLPRSPTSINSRHSS